MSRLFSRPEFSRGTALSSTPGAQMTCKDGGGGGWGGGGKQAGVSACTPINRTPLTHPVSVKHGHTSSYRYF